ncbi:helix-turn-helix domain-containing protein [Salinispirillum marinum]|uniref:Helix-turn-helix domain-containing protein n=2 Tax=Saccharospirillaceae TaxID=255527 RepID=A0ABV8BIS2_9GAMM
MVHSRPGYELIEPQESCFQFRAHGADSDLVRWHFHPEYELHLLVSSRGQSFVGDYMGTFEPGCLVLTGPHLPHNWISQQDVSDGLRDLVINFSDDFMQRMMDLVPESRAMSRMLRDAWYGIQFTTAASESVTPLFWAMSRQTGFARFVTFMRIMEQLAVANAYVRLSTRCYDASPDADVSDRIGKVVRYITDRVTEPLTLEEVAAHIHLSPVAFSRYFHRATGHKFKEFVLRLRIGKACELLEETDWPITQVCYEAGFTNLSNFNRRFLAIKQMTPSDFRAQAAQR